VSTRRRDRVGLSTTTISVKLTAPELEALDGERAHHESLFDQYRWYSESRGDVLRRLISEAAERRVEVQRRNDPRQVTLNEAIAASTPSKTEQLDSASELPRKTKPRRAGLRHVRKTGAAARGGRKARIRR